MSEMFGGPIGFGAAEEDLLRNAQTQRMLGEVAMQPTDLRIKQAQAEALETANAQERQLQQLMMLSGAAPGTKAELVESGTGGQAGLMLENMALNQEKPSASIVDRLDSLTRLTLDAGMVTKASELAKTTALLRSREAAAGASQATSALNKLKVIGEQASLSAQIFGGAKDEATWAQANDLFEFQTGAPSPYRNVPFSPQLVEQINSSALTIKERIDATEKRLSRESLVDFRERRLAQHDTAADIRRRQLDIQKQREDRLRKNGTGRGTSSPTTAETSQIRRMLSRDYPNLDATEAGDAAYNLAAEARALRRQNPALDAAQALAQAYTAARQGGDFETVSTPTLGFGGKQRYIGGGKSPATAISLPDKPTAKTLKANRFYINAAGVVAKWTGKGFEVAGGGLPLSENNSDLDEDEDEDDE